MHFVDLAMAFLNSLSGPVMVGIAAVIEMGLRLIKSPKPLSILHLFGDGAHKIGALLVKIGDVLDKILPQRIA